MGLYRSKDMYKLTGITQMMISRMIKNEILHPYKNERGLYIYSQSDLDTILAMKLESFKGEIREIPGYPRYYTDTKGNVYSARYGLLRIMHPALDKDGYPYVTLRVPGMYNTPRVHKLIALSYISNPENKPEVNHKDGVKRNNTPGNLEWATSKENSVHAVKMNLRHPKKGSNHHSSIPVEVYDANMCKIAEYESQNQACIGLNCSTTAVCRIIKSRSTKEVKSKSGVMYYFKLKKSHMKCNDYSERK